MELAALGKIGPDTFRRLIFPHLGHQDASVMIGPRHGVDAAAINLGDDQVMVIAEDPTFGMPALMPHLGWAIVHISASDVAVMGLGPRYLSICLLLPTDMPEAGLRPIWEEIDSECKRLGIAIIGGHTGRYPGISYPLNGGCTVIGIGRKDQLTPASNAQVGDRIVITKGPAIEATGILAYQAAQELVARVGKSVVSRAQDYFFKMSVVEDAMLAAPFAHAMHDATEGGLLNGVCEVAQASGVGATIYEDSIVIPEEVEAVCRHFKLDPLISISEGTLIVSVPQDKRDELIKVLAGHGIPAWDVGEVTEQGLFLKRRDGSYQELEMVSVDPFWEAYFSTLGA